MSDSENDKDVLKGPAGVSHRLLGVLESLDNMAHVIVAFFFIILAASVLVYAGLLIVRDIPLIVQSPHAIVTARSDTKMEHTKPDDKASEPINTSASEPSLFLHRSLGLLSALLFVVIVLELLKTIITYLKTHNIQAIMKEFLVVGIISSIRKILLVGAESSLGSTDPSSAYIKEATGTVITIAGILLLIAGLLFLQRSEDRKMNS